MKTKTEYSTCLVRTQKTLLLDAKGAQFTPWASSTSSREVWDVIKHRYVDYIGGHCLSVTPPPAALLSHLHPPGTSELPPETYPPGSRQRELPGHRRRVRPERMPTLCRPVAPNRNPEPRQK